MAEDEGDVVGEGADHVVVAEDVGGVVGGEEGDGHGWMGWEMEDAAIHGEGGGEGGALDAQNLQEGGGGGGSEGEEVDGGMEGKKAFKIPAKMGCTFGEGTGRDGVGGGEAAGGIADVGGDESPLQFGEGEVPGRSGDGSRALLEGGMGVSEVVEGEGEEAADDEAEEGAREADEGEA